MILIRSTSMNDPIVHSHVSSQVFLLAKDSVIALQLGFEDFECCFPGFCVVCEAPASEQGFRQSSRKYNTTVSATYGK